MARFKAAYYSAVFASALRGRTPARFAVVTAHDPRGRKAPAARNRRRDAALRRRLDALGLRRFRVTGGNEDGSHREAGWGIVVDAPAKARALAAEFAQEAYYWVSGDRIYLGSAAGGALEHAGS
ncbi:MAG: DUF3293 domain-containing protein, partial [Elusimicrobia bacterium]|nr:DUF3293 domain-containing protein [Elusimicrobiota bacterium]